jgi:hypothetical protein
MINILLLNFFFGIKPDFLVVSKSLSRKIPLELLARVVAQYGVRIMIVA